MKRIGLALSGGGFRATLFALGSLMRLNEAGMLTRLTTITSVSGGAITAGYLAAKWDKLHFEESALGGHVAVNFDAEVVQPIIEFCRKKVDVPVVLRGLLSLRGTIGDKLIEEYDRQLFHGQLLSETADLPNAPEFVFYGTNYDTGASVRITKEYFRDYRVGKAVGHSISIAQAVGVSSAFPPIFSPITLDGSDWNWKPTPFSDLHESVSLRERIVLCDGGLYDNMGVEMLWKAGPERRYDTVFVCDAGAPLGARWSRLAFLGRYNWIAQFSRMNDIMISQQRALRKRRLMDIFSEGGDYDGAYWGIDVDIGKYPVDAIVANEDPFNQLKLLPTQLRPFSNEAVDDLINWAYGLTDAAIRGRYDSSVKRGSLPRRRSVLPGGGSV